MGGAGAVVEGFLRSEGLGFAMGEAGGVEEGGDVEGGVGDEGLEVAEDGAGGAVGGWWRFDWG